jgi:hypothetical protein
MRFDMGSNSHVACGLVPCRFLAPKGPLLTNRMSELFKYGSVGGGGREPAPYPAGDAGLRLLWIPGSVVQRA